MVCEASLQNCKGQIDVACRSTSQDNTEFENSLSDFNGLLSKTISLFTMILGNFNAKSSSVEKKNYSGRYTCGNPCTFK